MTQVGFVGLGIMGAPMAVNLVRAGFTVVGYDPVPRGPEQLVAAGGRAGTSIAQAVATADVVVTMLPDSPQVEQVALGPGGVLDAVGATVVHVGGDGAGQTVKVANQLVVAGVIELVTEAIVLLEACDVAAKAALDVLAGGLVP